MKRKLLIVAAASLGFISSTALYANQASTLLNKLFLNSAYAPIQCAKKPITQCTPGSADFCDCMNQAEISGCLDANLNWKFCCINQQDPSVENIVKDVCNGIGIKNACIQNHSITHIPVGTCIAQFNTYLKNNCQPFVQPNQCKQ